MTKTFVRNRRGSLRGKKGIGSLVGMAIFLLLFSMAVSYVYLWSQNTVQHVTTFKEQSALDDAKLRENLLITPINSKALNITNPTTQTIVVSQIWSNHSLIWSGNLAIAPFSSNLFSNPSSPANGAFEVVTTLGNIFNGGLTQQFSAATLRTWQVTVFNNIITPPVNATDLASKLSNGTSFWNDLSYSWVWSSSTPMGLIANTTVMKTSGINSNATINYYIDQNSEILVYIDGHLQQPPAGQSWYTWANYAFFSINGTQYSTHTITVYYYGPGPQDVLKLNIINATFLP
jgi:hypothetical protein